MDKEQRMRMSEREFIGTDPEQTEITYTIQVSGGRAWLHRTWEEDWDNESGTGPDTGHDCWPMSTEDLKKFVKFATTAIQKSEEFEAAHPQKPDSPAAQPGKKNRLIKQDNKLFTDGVELTDGMEIHRYDPYAPGWFTGTVRTVRHQGKEQLCFVVPGFAPSPLREGDEVQIAF